ncbi:extracellular metalloprotease-like protein 1 [Elsinoe australis]|uniref:Extracellular metalloprotease-like protein 1 n=1 Tax=Elsinoe australis TaxID=40998 RepID=A0A4V6DTQ5_9PEZI|nr:extracellular metalloprotease-like protein 1 [Elsinoe australis]
MRLPVLSLFGLIPIAVLGFDCYNNDTASDTLDIALTNPPPTTSDFAIQAVTQVNLYVHVIVSQALTTPPKTLVEAKIATLNRNFKPAGFQFTIQGISTTVNANWAKDVDTAKAAKQAQLHRGNYQTLNVYMIEGATSGLCSLPTAPDKPLDQNGLIGDGCFVPWGPATEAATLTHEVGHWFGLLHVFQGGCGGSDGCDDTKPQEGPSYAKQSKAGDLGSCPAKEQCGGTGVQNVKNFMDYSDCSQEFTQCQRARMSTIWTNRRKGRKLG